MSTLPAIKPGRVILHGSNPFIWLSDSSNGDRTTDASVWTITFSPYGFGHVLFIKSELTDNNWKIYSDNLSLARWMQETVQGMLNPETACQSIPVTSASFSAFGDARTEWKHTIKSTDDTIELIWQNMEQPILVQDDIVSESDRPYAVSAVMSASNKARVLVNGRKANGDVWPMDLNGHPFLTGALAFAESWREESD
ncbi:hypothetical protein [Vibrio harveyi]|uniref:hypothetical protein n=1 Tax=Vibrio harveyi TaxID=669 RepID=UPI0023800BE2|nr:hypothetical protein [Vibrio harveyi]